MHIQLRNGDKWAAPLDAIFGAKTPYGFIVQDRRDVRLLSTLFEKYEYGMRFGRTFQPHDVFFMRLDQRFDIRSGLPEEDNRWTTVYKELEVDFNYPI
jgi:hypothetical protein